MADFTALYLGCAIKGIELPAELLVREIGQNGSKNHYLDALKLFSFSL
jgi:hypothetical protein